MVSIPSRALEKCADRVAGCGARLALALALALAAADAAADGCAAPPMPVPVRVGDAVVFNLAAEADGKLTLGECVDAAKLASGVPGMSPTDLAALADLVRKAPTSPFAPYASALAGLPAVNPKCAPQTAARSRPATR